MEGVRKMRPSPPLKRDLLELGSSLFSVETPIPSRIPLRMKIDISGLIATLSPTAA
jgi:hypothetical protein